MDEKRCVIDERKGKDRKEVIKFLEDMGYALDQNESRSQKEILDSPLPIYVDKKSKSFWMMGNVTCAAAAVSSNKMIHKMSFYEWMNH